MSSEPVASPPDPPASPLPLMEASGGALGGTQDSTGASSPSGDAPGSGGIRRFVRPRVIVPVVLVIAFSVWWFGFRSDGGSSTPAAAATQTIATVTRGSMSQSVSSEGTVAAAQTSDLSFPSSGTVTAVNVKVGDAVTTGEVLATIDSAQLQSGVSSAESTVADAEAKLADDQAAGASDAQITADQTSVTSANDSLTNAQQALAGASLVATFDGTVSQVNLTVGEKLSSGGTGGTGATGSASGSGRSSASIGSSNSGFGATAGSSTSSSSTAQVEVVSKGLYTVSLSVDSNDIDGVAVGQPATVTLSTSSAGAGGFGGFGGFGGRFGGRFGGAAAGGTGAAAGGTGAAGGSGGSGTGAAAGGATSAATATGTVTDVAKVASASSGVATYPVTVTFTSDASDFYVGSTVTAAITTNTRNNVLEVPTLALTSVGGSPAVTVATNGTVSGHTETVPVKTGLTANGMVEITAGLKEGQKVVVTVPAVFGNLGSGASTTGSSTNGSTTGRGTFPGGGQFGGGRFGGGATSGGTGQ